MRVNEDVALVHRLQKNHGEWADDMALVGLVISRLSTLVNYSHKHKCTFVLVWVLLLHHSCLVCF